MRSYIEHARRWREPIQAFLDSEEAWGVDQRERGALRADLVRLSRRHLNPWRVTPEQAAAFVDSVPAPAAAAVTLSAFYRWAVGAGHTRRSPAPAVGVLPAAQAGRDLPEAWRHPFVAYAAHLAETPISTRSAGRNLDHLQRFAWTVTDPWNATQEHVDRFTAAGISTPASASALRGFYRWAVRVGHLPSSPCMRATPPGPPRSATAVSPAWCNALNEWAIYSSAAGVAASTQKLRRHYLQRFAVNHADPYQVTPMDLLTFLAVPDWSPATRSTVRSALRSFYASAVQLGHLDESPAQRLPSPRIPPAVPRPVPDRVAATALSATTDPRVVLALLLARLAGLRAAEIASLHERHVEPERLRITGKGGRTRIVPIHPDLRTPLSEAAAAARARRDGWIFPRLHRWQGTPTGEHLTPGHIGHMIKKELTEGYTAHKLRHAAATSWYGVDRDLFAVQQLLGHSSPATTARYVEINETTLAAAVFGGGSLWSCSQPR